MGVRMIKYRLLESREQNSGGSQLKVYVAAYLRAWCAIQHGGASEGQGGI